MPETLIRPAKPEDAGHIVRLVQALAAYENEPLESVRITEEDVLRDGFSENPRFETLLAEVEGEPVGFALYFHNYSTWEGRAGLYIEDLFVEERARGLGLGRALLTEIARIAKERGCRRIDLWVLHWNPTREFYRRIGLKHMEDWLPYRMVEPDISNLAEG